MPPGRSSATRSVAQRSIGVDLSPPRRIPVLRPHRGEGRPRRHRTDVRAGGSGRTAKGPRGRRREGRRAACWTSDGTSAGRSVRSRGSTLVTSSGLSRSGGARAIATRCSRSSAEAVLRSVEPPHRRRGADHRGRASSGADPRDVRAAPCPVSPAGPAAARSTRSRRSSRCLPKSAAARAAAPSSGRSGAVRTAAQVSAVGIGLTIPALRTGSSAEPMSAAAADAGAADRPPLESLPPVETSGHSRPVE